ncbi:prenyltransferase alpha subunit repeat protein [Histoplasma capsulatum G186AR]|uniref:Geranylgeranyl transferase type-2 subunit alpha n=1 Tax=Ajellomyces capsulatus (strain G186AR / H82 / ATCC MYA-2454 / RMSCC 2432) TaxID=447093 RepID=C0NK00_AJECG|nr:RAB-protein geranylgeranyltransferase [Histoplasma capsulatum G186AR]XP_045288723.1 prenyltransferase alpha subunit repeat protein [Histoplasma capsulatum G186AR]EEH08191.1 RAB-protein geranylgeranyltransferase [Histoplasma capsulatum G186AR]EEH08242.1 prenyltransferase alpha subunit repeat protein [Histoplasma capsulatum G186AR]
MQRTEAAWQKESQKIQTYNELVSIVNSQRAEHDFSTEALNKTSELLTKNPEYYTIWNTRRLILQHQFSKATSSGEGGGDGQIKNIIKADLQFLFPLLRGYPKCYWIWNHRLWDLEQTTLLLPTSISRSFWQEELALVGKLLSLDSRNFHGWGYRRQVVSALEELASKDDEKEAHSEDAWTPASMAKAELDYTTKMIGTNLSNFSAWHNRTQLILRLLDEQSASDEERKKMLDSELKLIHRALIDPYDQSLWFYHQNLMCTFDPALASGTMAPNLTDIERLEYLENEVEAITEMLDGEEDCKWIYQALISCGVVICRVKGVMSTEMKQRISGWAREVARFGGLTEPVRAAMFHDIPKHVDN